MTLSISCHWWNSEFYVQENKQVQENRSEHTSKVRHEQADLSKAKSEHSNVREHLKNVLVKNKSTSTQRKIDQDKLFEEQDLKYTSLIKYNQVKSLEEQVFKTIQGFQNW